MPLPRYYKTQLYTEDQRQLLWLYAEDKGVKWVKGFEVQGANGTNRDYYEALVRQKNEEGAPLHGDVEEDIIRKKAINRMNICKQYGYKNDGSQDNEIITKIQRLFLERIRKEKGYSIKHWCVTEKGHTNTRRRHIHGLYYATHGETKWQLTKTLFENWIDGYRFYGSYVNEKTINYVSKYMTKRIS